MGEYCIALGGETGEPKFGGILSLGDVGLCLLDDGEFGEDTDGDGFWSLLELGSGICNNVRLESFLRDFVSPRSSLAHLSETSAYSQKASENT